MHVHGCPVSAIQAILEAEGVEGAAKSSAVRETRPGTRDGLGWVRSFNTDFVQRGWCERLRAEGRMGGRDGWLECREIAYREFWATATLQ